MRRKSPTHPREARLGLLDMGAIGGHALVLMSVGGTRGRRIWRAWGLLAVRDGRRSTERARARGIDVTLASSVRFASRGCERRGVRVPSRLGADEFHLRRSASSV